MVRPAQFWAGFFWKIIKASFFTERGFGFLILVLNKPKFQKKSVIYNRFR